MPSSRPATASPQERSWSRQQKRFIQAAGSTSHEFGLGRLVGRIYALLMLEPHPVCLDDIVGRLSISKASASITLRRLAAWKMVRRTTAEKDRRDFYQVQGDFLKVLREGMVPLATSKLTNAGQMLDSLLGAVPAPQPGGKDSAESGDVRHRLQEAKALQEKLSFVIQSGLLSRFLQ